MTNKKNKEVPAEILKFYQDLEAIDNFNNWDLTLKVKPLETVFSDEWNQKLIAENICMKFNLEEGRLSSYMSQPCNNGNKMDMPELQDFNPEQIEYIKERVRDTKNNFLLAQYNYLLFEIDKNNQYAIRAIQAFKRILSNEEYEFEKTSSCILSIIRLCERVKSQADDNKQEIISRVSSAEMPLEIRWKVVLNMADSALFKARELLFIPKNCLQWIKGEKERSYRIVKELLEVAIKLALKNNEDTSSIYNALAENENLLLQQHQDDKSFVKATILGEQMEYYKKAKNKVKYEETQKEYTRVKSLTVLPLIEVPLGDEFHEVLNAEIKRQVEIIMKWDVNAIFAHFSIHCVLFPSFDDIVIQATKRYDQSFLRHVSHSAFDVNLNSKCLSEDTERERQIFDEYNMALSITTITKLISVLHIGVINFKISYSRLYNYFKECTWYGQNLPKPSIRSQKGSSSYNWLDYMAPALHSFLMHFEVSVLQNKKMQGNFLVLSIDSLTLKFEGALRDFIRVTGGSTSIVKRDSIQEMLLEDLLASEIAKKYFDKNDISLFQLTFTNKGENIRNNVAHCFYFQEDYTLEKMCKIFLCILRLGKYVLE